MASDRLRADTGQLKCLQRVRAIVNDNVRSLQSLVCWFRCVIVWLLVSRFVCLCVSLCECARVILRGCVVAVVCRCGCVLVYLCACASVCVGVYFLLVCLLAWLVCCLLVCLFACLSVCVCAGLLLACLIEIRLFV